MTDLSGHDPEERTARLLHGAATGLTSDVDTLVRGGVARGRTMRRRRRVGTSLAAAAVVGVIGVAASVAPGLLDDAGPGAGAAPGYADGASTATVAEPQPAEPELNVMVAARDVPAVFAEALGGAVGPVRQDDTYPLVDEPERKIVHFSYEGTLTTFGIERADSLASCGEMVDPADQPDVQPVGECVVRDGVELLLTGPTTADGVTSQGVMAWRHGYVISALSYNAAEGKDVAPLAAEPPITMDQLEQLTTSEAWFSQETVVDLPQAKPRIAVKARQIPGLVTAIVPGEVVPNEQAGGYLDLGGDVVAHFRLDGYLVSAGISKAVGDPMKRCREGYPAPGACAEQPDGSVLARGGDAGPAADGGVVTRSVGLYLPGFDVFVMSYNAADAKGSPALSPEPPLTYADLEAVATSDGWVTAG